jgi:glycosyltransferase involved in cell wall biosynthesis
MALGKPVVAAVPGGPEEIIEDGVDGLLTPFGDASALGVAVQRYLSEPEFAAEIGIRAREKAQAFSAPLFAERVGVALRQLLGGTES